jgi:putative membrane protein
MLHPIVSVLVTALAVLLASKVVPGLRVKSFGSAVFFAVVLGLLNFFLVKLLWILSIPFIVVTFGLGILVVGFVINCFLFWLADKVVDGVEADGFGAVVLGSAMTSLATWGIDRLLHI